jgi:UDP-glucose 4-epimerase
LLAMGVREEAVGEAINLGSGKEHTVKEMAELVNRITSNRAGIKFVERRDWDVKRRLLSSIEKANRILNFKPKVSFHDGVEKVNGWFEANWNKIQQDAEF